MRPGRGRAELYSGGCDLNRGYPGRSTLTQIPDAVCSGQAEPPRSWPLFTATKLSSVSALDLSTLGTSEIKTEDHELPGPCAGSVTQFTTCVVKL